MESVKLSRQLIEQMLHHARLSPRLEVCGFITAKAGRARRCVAVPNVADQPGRRFTMDPASQIRVQRRMREQGEQLFGIYHSHPNAPAQPSATDLRLAAYPDALYIIISLVDPDAPEVRGFRIKQGRANPVHLAF